jgi:hypothetical protein
MSSSFITFIDLVLSSHDVSFILRARPCGCTLDTRGTNTEDVRFRMKRPLRDDAMSLMTTTEDEWASRLGLGYDDVLEYTYDVIV